MLPSSSNLDSEGDVFLRKEGGRGGIARLGCLLAPVDFDVTHTRPAAGGILLTACCFFCTLYVSTAAVAWCVVCVVRRKEKEVVMSGIRYSREGVLSILSGKFSGITMHGCYLILKTTQYEIHTAVQ